MATQQSAVNPHKTTNVKLGKLKAGRNRLRFKEEGVELLKESIMRHGLLNPIVARRSEDGALEVIAGHRRLEALRRIGAEAAACKIVEATDREAFEISLVENLQRDSISPVEEAMAFHQYIDIYKWGNQRVLANRVGKSPEYISHRLQLLHLPQNVLSQVGSQLSTSHAEELAWLDDEQAASRLFDLTIEKKLSVHTLHELVKLEKRRQRRHTQSPPESEFDTHWQSDREENQISEILRTSVVAIRYVMHYLDGCVDSVGSEREAREATKFLMEERYKVHQILDDFVKAEIRTRRALRYGSKVLSLR